MLIEVITDSLGAIQLNVRRPGSAVVEQIGDIAGSYAASMGALSSIEINPNRANLGNTAVGHMFAVTGSSVIDGVAVLSAFVGETPAERLDRLGTEYDLSLATPDYLTAPAVRMGKQEVAPILDLIQDCANIDGGVMIERRDDFGLKFRALRSMYSQLPVTIPYTDNLVDLEPTDDDKDIRNRVTVTRDGGTSSTVELASNAGWLSIDNVGLYDLDVTLPLGYDVDTIHQAGWRLRLGTVDEARYPSIGIDLAHPSFVSNPTLTRSLLDIEIGDRIDVTNLPDWLVADSLSAIVQGIEETITPFHYKLTYITTPASPYNGIGVWGSSTWAASSIATTPVYPLI